MSTTVLFLTYALFSLDISHSLTFYCNSFQQCDFQYITCSNNGACFVYCNGEQSCKDSIITCPDDYDCHIQCVGTDSCYGANINCPINGECNIDCTGIGSCHDSRLFGAESDPFNVNCANSYSCSLAHINGRDVSALTIYGCVYEASCIGISIYCPQNDKGVKKCTMSGDNSFGGIPTDPIDFYAINGWNDVNINVNSPNRYGYMACLEGLTEVCIIEERYSNDPWRCTPTNHICNNVPTKQPTAIPTTPTLAPTKQPTINPTTPTAVPTSTPTLMEIPNATSIDIASTSSAVTSEPTLGPVSTASPSTSTSTSTPPTASSQSTTTSFVPKTSTIEICDKLTILISFHYDVPIADILPDDMSIKQIIGNVTNEFMDKYIIDSMDCLLIAITFPVIHLHEDDYECDINSTLCLDCIDRLNNNDYNMTELERDFIKTFHTETELIAIVNSSTIIKISINKPDKTSTNIPLISTTILQSITNDDDSSIWGLIYGLCGGLLLCFICLCILFMIRYRKKTLKNNVVNVVHVKPNTIRVQSISTAIIAADGDDDDDDIYNEPLNNPASPTSMTSTPITPTGNVQSIKMAKINHQHQFHDEVDGDEFEKMYKGNSALQIEGVKNNECDTDIITTATTTTSITSMSGD